MSKVILFGGGGFAVEVIEYFHETFENTEHEIDGIIDEGDISLDKFQNTSSKKIKHYKSISDAPIENHKYLISVLDPITRERVFNELYNRKAKFLNLIHPTAYVAKSAKIGKGIIICPFAYIGPKSTIKDNVVLNIQSCVGHESYVGQSSFLGPGSRINGKGQCGKKCFLGTNAVINVNITLHNNSKLSIGSVLTKDCPKNSLAHGNPAQFREMFK
jgi:sugar O-acyltransferase (sialic acid O-acetyltransferase NeuD family)